MGLISLQQFSLRRRPSTVDPGRSPSHIVASRSSRVDVCGIPFTNISSLEAATALIAPILTSRLTRAFLVTFANPSAVSIIAKQPKYKSDLARMDMVLSDGIAVTIAARLLVRRALPRISFDSTGIGPTVFAIAARNGLRMMLVGGCPGIADAASQCLRQTFPTLTIIGALNGYLPLPTLVAETRAADPSIVICGMGIPQQEAFLVTLAESGWCGVGLTCGGYLDQLCERFDYYPALINRFNLRWCYRLFREPRRLGYRYLVEYRPFVWTVLRQSFGGHE